MKLLLMPALLLLSVRLVLGAQGPDEQYVRVYQTIQEADHLNEQGQTRAAATKYVEAQQELNRFRTVFPGWNERVINYRLSYVATKLAPLLATPTVPGAVVPASTNAGPTAPVPPATPPPTAAPTAPLVSTPPPVVTPRSATPTLPPPSAVELEQQMKPMQAELERLQAENRLLGAKLKEALSVQPASVDPREMMRAEERIRGLQKENELFKVQLAQKEATAVAPPAPPAPPASPNEVLTALRAENSVLKKQTQEWRKKYEVLEVAANKAKAKAEKKVEPKPEPAAKPARKQDAALTKLSSENLALQKQAALWQQVALQKQFIAPPPTPPAPVVSAAAVPSAASLPADAQRELEALRARVQVFEAQPVPYTTEELALFNRGPVTTPSATSVALAVTSPTAPIAATAQATTSSETPARPVSHSIPPGAGPLMRAAESAFARGDYAEAERKYLEVLRQDENNITTLGNLASAQVELGRFADAEQIVQRALKVDPNDDFSLYVLGRIRFHENKLDEALDALSRSAKANPDYADTQNYLGIVLSEKGLRGPAEAALRRAIQLQPNNPVAHNNLAVVYATQKPPALALARWHYHKAISSGHPKNAELEKMIDYKP